MPEKFDNRRLISCCFTGHRMIAIAPEDLEKRLTDTIGRLIAKGYQYFYAGGARGADAIFSSCVLTAKEKYPQIQFNMVLPFQDQWRREKGWTDREIKQYYDHQRRASTVTVIAQRYSPGVYYRRNKWMVDRSSLLVSRYRKTIWFIRTEKR